jgi:LuxR family maltose regulon positive regulatory protein
MQGVSDTHGFIQSFAGSHRFVLDYLLEEVLHKQTAAVQEFLLQTSILNRFCGALAEAVLSAPAGSGQATLAYLEQANLFIIPLDNERQWYRYHHLFADLLRQRLQHSPGARLTELHLRASQWFEDNDLDIEAFQHAAAANDVERAERLSAGRGIPLHLKGAVVMILDWLASLPAEVMNARPSLWWRHASLLLVNGHTTGVEEKLNAAEAALQNFPPTAETRYLTGRIANARAVLALTRYQPEVMIAQSRRALEYFPEANPAPRANVYWTLGMAYFYLGQRLPAREALTTSVALSQTVGDMFTLILASIGLGFLQEGDNELHLAEQTYRRVLQWAGDQPLQIIYEAHLGVGRMLYEWNDLAGAQQSGEQSLRLAQQYDTVIDRFIVCEVFLARLQLARGDVAGAAATLAQAEQSARQRNFLLRLPDVAAGQVLVLLRQGHVTEAARLAQTYNLSLAQARVLLAQNDAPAALALLATVREQMETRGWADERLKAMTLQTVAHFLQGDKAAAHSLLAEVLTLAEPQGFIRLFVDEGPPMFQLLSEAKDLMPTYVGKLLAAFAPAPPATPQPLLDPLSPRELEVLRLIEQGLSNTEIGQRLFLALDTVKGHNRKIFEKLHVQRRTEAVARARELGLL